MPKSSWLLGMNWRFVALFAVTTFHNCGFGGLAKAAGHLPSDQPADASRPNNNRYAVSIPGGGILSVIAICSDYNRADERWWLPNGEPTIQLAGPKSWSRGGESDNSLLVALRVVPASTPVKQLQIEIEGAHGWCIYGMEETERVNESGKDARILYISGPISRERKTFKLSCTGSTTEWAQLARLQDSKTLEQNGILISHIRQEDEYIYSITHRQMDVEYRIRNADPKADNRVSRP